MKKMKWIMVAVASMAFLLAGCAGANESDAQAGNTAGDVVAEDSVEVNVDFAGDITVVSREDGSGTRGAFIELFGIEQKDENGEKVSLAKLLADIDALDFKFRLRFMTSHPKDLSDELIQVMKHSKKICRHLHLPLQSGSTRILQAMNRRYTKEQYLELAERIRREIPDIAITTDIIVGFPGETTEDVEETIDVIRKVKYDNAFTFIYSKRTGTPAAAMENQVPEAEVKVGFDKVLKCVQETAKEQVSRYQGQVMEALVEERNENDEKLLTGRLSNNTLVHFPGDVSLVGKIVKVSLDECHGFYYMGHQVEV